MRSSPARGVFVGDAELPEAAVVDSSFLLAALIDPGRPLSMHQDCVRLAYRLRSARTRLIVSSLALVHAAACWRRLYRRGLLRPPVRGYGRGANRQEAFVEATTALRLFLAQFDVIQVPLSDELTEEATALAGFYNLGAHDAVQAAVAILAGVFDVIALDRDLAVVEEIRLWLPMPLLVDA